MYSGRERGSVLADRGSRRARWIAELAGRVLMNCNEHYCSGKRAIMD